MCRNLKFQVVLLLLGLMFFSGIAVADPTVESIDPANGSTFGGTLVSISGYEFVVTGTTRITFDGVDATNVIVLPPSCPYGPFIATCRTPAHAAATVDVVVINPSGGSGTLPMGFTYDGRPPAPEITAPNGGNDVSTKIATLTLSGNCSATTTAIHVYGSANNVTYTPGATTWFYTYTLSSQGTSLFYVTALNLIGESERDTIQVTYDTIAPAAPVITAPMGGNNFRTNVAALTLSGTCSADTNTFQVNGSPAVVTRLTSTTWSYSTTLATQGATLFSVRALDLATNVSPADTITVTLDSIPPAVPVITTNGGNDFSTNVGALILDGSRTLETDAIWVNGSPTGVSYPTTTSWRYTKTLTTQGANLFSVTALDQATNESAADTITVTFDNVAPTVSSVTSSLTDGSYTTGQVVPIAVTFSEPVYFAGAGVVQLQLETGTPDRQAVYGGGSGTAVLTFNYTVVGGDVSPDLQYLSTAALTLTGSATLKDAVTNIAVLALPALNLPSSLGGSKAIVIDTTAPEAPVIMAPTATLTFLTKVAGLTLSGTCAVGVMNTNAIHVNGSTAGVSYTPGAGTWSYDTTLLTQGAHLFSVTAVDLATNVSVADTITVTFDSDPPQAPVITTNDGYDFSTKFSELTLSGTCAADTDVIRVNGSTAGVTLPTATTWLYDTTLAEGANGFSVTATDQAANESVADTITVTLDNIAPEAPVITAPNSGDDFLTNVAALTLSGTCALDTNAIEVNGSASGVTYTPGETTWLYDTTLSMQGANVFNVRALDLATNASTPDTITVTFDNMAPEASITLDEPTPTNLDVVHFSVDFNEYVGTSFTVANVTVIGTLAGTPVVSGTDPDYTVTVTLDAPDVDGTVGITIDTAVTDLADNPFAGDSSSMYIVDNTPPTASIALDDSTPTNLNAVHFSEDFSEYVGASFTAADVTVTGTLAGTPVVSGTDPDYTVTVTLDNPDADGTVGIYVGTAVTDLADNPFAGNTSSLYTVDNTPPTATIVLDDPTPTKLDVVHFSEDFSERVGTSFTAADVTVVGTLGGTPVVSGTDPDYTVSVTLDNPDADGTVGIYVGTAVTDLADNPYAGNTSSLYTVDNTPPVVTVGTPPYPNVTNNVLPLLTGTATDAVGVTDVQVTINGKTYPAQLAGNDWNVQLPPGDELVGLPPTTYEVTVVATDLAGNVGTDTSTNEIRINTAAPTTVEGVLLVNATPTRADSVVFRVVFSLGVSPVVAGDFAVAASAGITGAAITTVVQDALDPKVWLVTVSTGTGDGILSLDVTDPDRSMLDIYGHPVTVPFTTGETYRIDKTHPTPVITGASTLTNATRTLSIAFGEPVNGLSLPGGVSVTNGVASNLHLTGTPGAYTVDVRGSGTVTVSVSIPASVATDDAANPNNATAAPFTFPFDDVAPTASITLDDPISTDADVVHFSVDFNESLGTLLTEVEDVTVTGTLAGTPVVTGTDPDYTVTVTLADPNATGTVGISVGTMVTDLAGNSYLGGASPMYTIAAQLPVAGLIGLGALLGLIAVGGARTMRKK